MAAGTIAHSDGLPEKRIWSSSSVSWSGAEGVSKALALAVLRNSLQNRHFTARNWIISAQKGQGLVCGGLVWTVSIRYISEMSGGFGQDSLPEGPKKIFKKM
jgi:hypothetical protein